MMGGLGVSAGLFAVLLACVAWGPFRVGGCDLLRWSLGRSSPVEDVTTRELDLGAALPWRFTIRTEKCRQAA
ncbi:hypothetical protein M747DRAFT_41591 [Aspergillus niger ATCC 13496]|uniref:Uncharacterized protein n=1 Tax=Aspergillus niger ATCC 13496 TaxID=1353008 RepID=A0A370BXQ8_ASPNG|nr:hypothetical protein M747DRAFT_41591 [Aspergillus niger ATCC 13496]